jgi:hypothetical protein
MFEEYTMDKLKLIEKNVNLKEIEMCVDKLLKIFENSISLKNSPV